MFYCRTMFMKFLFILLQTWLLVPVNAATFDLHSNVCLKELKNCRSEKYVVLVYFKRRMALQP